MPDKDDIKDWPKKICQRYESYLKTSFFFKYPNLRKSFQEALRKEGSLMKDPIPEEYRSFKKGLTAQALAQKFFPSNSDSLLPTLIDEQLYTHQENAIRAAHSNFNIVVATGTASGKTESFLYPILFELYQQYLDGELERTGVRAMILYPMNALANDQRERLGEICKNLEDAGSRFKPTFGQYIGQTPNNARDYHRNATTRREDRLPGELIFRDDMRKTPPHILLTNYSMLEYLLIRPDDSPLFDNGMGKHWQFIVLDEAHQYRGAKGMEMGMLIRRLKQRLRDGGRQEPFRCIATSATISSGKSEQDKQVVANFAKELFGEKFSANDGIIFGDPAPSNNETPTRYHAFFRALEGAFLIHKNGEDIVVLNRKSEGENEKSAVPLEIALCRECGQHYYVGREHEGKLVEAIRDPSDPHFGVDYYLPLKDDDNTGDGHALLLCRSCSKISKSKPECSCNATIFVKKCEPHKDHADQLVKCEICDYKRGGIGDPVQEIVHGTDGPNAVIATAMHELLPENKRKVLAFADSRQEAAFFAWYAEDSYEKLRDRNLLLRAMTFSRVDKEGLSIDDLKNRLLRQCEQAGLFVKAETKEQKSWQVLTSILREALTDERRLSLSGVGLVKWFVKIPEDLIVPEIMLQPPWSFTREEALCLIGYLLDELRLHRAMNLPENAATPDWNDVSPDRIQISYCKGKPGRQKGVSQWGSPQSAVVKYFLRRLLEGSNLLVEQHQGESTKLMEEIWDVIRKIKDPPILSTGSNNGTFRLNPCWLRIKPVKFDEIWQCDTCASLSTHNIRNVCPRNRCPGFLNNVEEKQTEENHYRIIYKSTELPPSLSAKEHTAQIDTDKARQRQQEFKDGKIHLLSSSTTFEVGVDLGDLEIVFLRNVPPESFNYIQRVGRAGRRDTPGLAITYCRRNPHDLYHYEDPNRAIKGTIHPPHLNMTNEKIVLRHMVATVLSAFFRENEGRFKGVESFIKNWDSPAMVGDVRQYCEENNKLQDYLCQIVPQDMHEKTGLENGEWVKYITGDNSRLAISEKEVSEDYKHMDKIREEEASKKNYSRAGRIVSRMKTIASEKTLDFLSRKAVIPKYGFPVDVVELDTRSADKNKSGITLQRDLSQAIAEYAPDGKVVANKLEWKSCGVKVVSGKRFPVRYYQYDNARNFNQWNEGDPSKPEDVEKKYLIPEFGFVTPFLEKPKPPSRRTPRLYTTRPFFLKPKEENELEPKNILGVQVIAPQPGTLVILCEGKNMNRFYVCLDCGCHMAKTKKEHKSPFGSDCKGMLKRFSLGHEMVTDVVRLQFPDVCNEWKAYSVAYAVLLGTAETLSVPASDLNVTITGGRKPDESAIVLYDNVPGGAGLVAQLEQEEVFREMITNAKNRVVGNCGCDSSCYGCLRSYRNQFAHPHLDRRLALEVLEGVEKNEI